MAMEVILTDHVDNLGEAGELVTVKNGFGRNYLLPKGLAITANRRNIARLEHERARIAREVAQARASAEGLAERLNGMTLRFERRVGEGDKMFGSVTAKDLATQLAVAGVELDTKKIKMDPVKALGKYETDVKLGSGIVASLKFWIVGKDE